MEQYVIRGGNPLVGEVEIGGAKNAALAILTAATMTDETAVLMMKRLLYQLKSRLLWHCVLNRCWLMKVVLPILLIRWQVPIM